MYSNNNSNKNKKMEFKSWEIWDLRNHVTNKTSNWEEMPRDGPAVESWNSEQSVSQKQINSK